MNDDKWIAHLQQMESEYEEQAPTGLLDDIMNELPRRRRRRRIALWTRLTAIAAAACAAILLGVSVLRNNLDADTTQLISEIEADKTTSKPAPTDTPYSQPDEKFVAAVSPKHAPVSSSQLSENVEDEPIVSNESEQTIEPSSTENDGDKHQQEAETTKKPAAGTPTRTLDMPNSTDFKSSSRKRAGIKASLFASGRITMDLDEGDMALANDSYQYMGNVVTSPDDESADASEQTLSGSNNSGAGYTEANHDTPLRFGLTLQVPITERIAIESGLIYSRLHSEMSSYNGVQSFSYGQTLHYIGVPLRVNYALWQNRRVCVYAKAGLMAEKLISSSINLESQAEIISKPEAPKEKPLQFSIGAAIGGSLRIINNIDLFVEPGVSHYLDNHSNICNVYKDRPTTFDLSVGLRINIPKR